MLNPKTCRYLFSPLILFLSLIISQLLNATSATENIIHDNCLQTIRIGDPALNIFSVFGSKYQAKKDYLTVTLMEKGRTVLVFTLDAHENISLIDIYDHYTTEKYIRCGSKLSDLIKAYGRGKLDPTDRGYFVWFKKPKGIMFLLNNADIPKELRNIPDDAIKPEDEKKILSLGNARVSVIRIFKTFNEVADE